MLSLLSSYPSVHKIDNRYIFYCSECIFLAYFLKKKNSVVLKCSDNILIGCLSMAISIGWEADINVRFNFV